MYFKEAIDNALQGKNLGINLYECKRQSLGNLKKNEIFDTMKTQRDVLITRSWLDSI